MESSPLARVPRRFQAMMNYLNAHQGSLISAFSVYSTALFLLLSLRLNTAIKYYTDGVTAFSDVCAQISCLTHLTQLYFTDSCEHWLMARCRCLFRRL